ncbi:glycine cleavage system H, mitochondrial [Paramuricea clavata]|uniref:Glycine cleavage system H protein n=1 Tax=Paramuricea clavata TaxID=317549 RepID=A0A6S7K7L4_PARCT|nr:glycine cleavage system H, mitochondrial [Paramuricea clavata]
MAAFRVGRGALNVLNSRLISPVLANKSSPCRKIHTAWLLNAERQFTKDHEWIVMSDNVGTIGISDYAQNSLGDIVYVELPDVGSTIEQNDTFGVVESVKAASDLYSPVTGEIVEVNEALTESPDLINKEPYDGGWIAKMKLSDLSQLDELMDEAEYNDFLKETEDE